MRYRAQGIRSVLAVLSSPTLLPSPFSPSTVFLLFPCFGKPCTDKPFPFQLPVHVSLSLTGSRVTSASTQAPPHPQGEAGWEWVWASRPFPATSPLRLLLCCGDTSVYNVISCDDTCFMLPPLSASILKEMKRF